MTVLFGYVRSLASPGTPPAQDAAHAQFAGLQSPDLRRSPRFAAGRHGGSRTDGLRPTPGGCCHPTCSAPSATAG
jgi:hypothetical protein